jgi:hypothetical protein
VLGAGGARDWPRPGELYALDGGTVAELLAWVSAETGWRVRYADPAAAALAERAVMHGSLAGLDAASAAFALLPGAGLRAERAGNELVVRRVER